ncbi:uncharacterized protein LOC141901606 isoform X2 [Tubulanus polymorphus]|uniref:uncharacterized protein LOC141901606 isoform X2 n=1 Tax=Tubulanus polymorphus TaxID=672921 RepID=UPI003DA50ACE
MADIYRVTSTEGVKSLERDLNKELNELKNEIEENEMVHGIPPKPICSVPLPKDVDYFRKERKLILDRATQVSEAHPIVIQADAMFEELSNADKKEYTSEGIPLLLHQYFTDRMYQLVQCKHMHMLRWQRFCEHTSTLETLYPYYQKRLQEIMFEYNDCIKRSQRLSSCREAFLGQSDGGAQFVTQEDLLIYMRWFITHLHSMKVFNQILRLIQWFPMLRKADVSTDVPGITAETTDESHTPQMASRYQDETTVIISRPSSSAAKSRPSSSSSVQQPPSPVPLPPPSVNPLLLTTNPLPPSVTAFAAAATGGGIAADESNLSLPLHVNDFDSLKPHLAMFVNMYGIQADVDSIKHSADEMELFGAVNRKFKQIFTRQETMLCFKTYDRLETGLENWGADHSTHCLKQDSNWIDFVKLKPEKDPVQERFFVKLKQDNNIDELLRAMSRFIQIRDAERVQDALREHAASVRNRPYFNPVSVTSNRTQNNTKAIWKKIYTNPELLTTKETQENLMIQEFEDKDTDNVNLANRSVTSRKRRDSYDYGTTVQILGLDDGDQDNKDPSSLQGAYLSFLNLRHLRIRDLRRTCLSGLNYFRSLERTLTVNDAGLSLESSRMKRSSTQNHRRGNASETGSLGGGGGLGSHHYLHNTPKDFKMSEVEFMEFAEIENHDDFYAIDEGRVHVQDQRGYYIMYDAAITDMKELENDLLLLATHYIEKDKDLRTASRINRGSARRGQAQAGDFDIPNYAHQEVDRFSILLDLWNNEATYMEAKRQLIDCYVEAYHHVFDRDEKRSLAQVITNLIHKRPRFDFNAAYFIRSYRMECISLRLQAQLVKSIFDKQIEEEREYLAKIVKKDDHQPGFPFKIIQKQPISINMSRPALRNVFMLEFHPSLAIASRIPEALDHAYWELHHMLKPESILEEVALQKSMLELLVEDVEKMEPLGYSYSNNTQKDLFADVFVEDPNIMTDIVKELIFENEQSGKQRSQKVKHLDMIGVYGNVLEMATRRHRLMDAAWEAEILSKIYKKQAIDLGFEECHLFLRFVQFEFANFKEKISKPPMFITSILDDDSMVDRYSPSNLYLGIQELDETHVGKFSFRSHEGLMKILKGQGLESLAVVLMCQIVHKNCLISAVQQVHGCQPVRPTVIDTKGGGRVTPTETKSEKSSMTAMTGISSNTGATQLLSTKSGGGSGHNSGQIPQSFVSLQLEKQPSHDYMLNEFVNKKSSMSTILKNPEEMEKIKRKLIAEYCHKLHHRFTQFSLRSQLIAIYNSIHSLLEQFPDLRDTYFMIGEPNEKKSDIDSLEGLVPDARSLKKRPRRLLSQDGRHFLNIWFIPHCTEILYMFKNLEDDQCNKILRYAVTAASVVHDVTAYLCSHAKLGSAAARRGKQPTSAEWGGVEGVGAELREIQTQINNLPDPTSLEQVVEFLVLRRNIMFLEYDVAVRITMRNTFLAMGNIPAYKAITDNMIIGLPPISNTLHPSLFATYLNVPEPLEATDFRAKELFPWRTFIGQNTAFPVSFWQWHRIEQFMHICMAGLKDVDKQIAHGEILGVSLLLEDVLNSGTPDSSGLLADSDDENADSSLRMVGHAGSRMSLASSYSRRSSSLYSLKSVGTKKALSRMQDPAESYRLLRQFLLLWKRLEVFKLDWGLRKLSLQRIDTVNSYKEFCIIYKQEKLLPSLRSIAARHGHPDFYDGLASDNEQLIMPPNSTDFEIKSKQLVRLCESLESHMIMEVRKKLAKELNLVLAERVREEGTLPTDLWKKPAMKESFTMNKPHISEAFAAKLYSDFQETETEVTFNKKHLNSCLLQLGIDVMERERHNYENYTMYYENVLRVHHQLLYQKEQEIKQLKDQLKNTKNDTMVDVQCQLADQSQGLLLEITALRAKIAEMREISLTQERDIRQRVKDEYDDLIRNLFSSAFELKTKFDEFRHELHDDVYEKIGEARREAIESMTKLKQKSGGTAGHDEMSEKHIQMSAKIRDFEHENFNMTKLMLKSRAMSNWRHNYTTENFLKQIAEIRKEADLSKKEYLEIKMLAEEEVILLRQQQVALRNYLRDIEKECVDVKKQLEKELKAKKEKTHAVQQKLRSQKQLEMAKQANAEQLLEELEEKELRLKALTEEQEKQVRLKQIAEDKARKDVSQVRKQLTHERNLKLNAFHRVDELQSQIYDGEIRPQTSTSLITVSRPRTSEPRSASVRRATSATVRSSVTTGTGVWPPPVSWPANRSVTPAPEGHNKIVQLELYRKFQRPKTVGGRLRSQIAEQLLSDLDPDPHHQLVSVQPI